MYANRCAIASGLFGIVLLLCLQSSGLKAAEGVAKAADGKSVEANKLLTLDLGEGGPIEFVLIRPGEFMMGDEEEKPVHKVVITKPFYLGKYEVTQKQWEAIMGNNPSNFRNAQDPVENVSWQDCQVFLKKLNDKFASSGEKFSLPTEAQWEYACRAGGAGKYCFGDSEETLAEYGWFNGNSGYKTHPVGDRKPNAWGLYDMHGNVWEWCADWYNSGYYGQSPTEDPVGPSSGSDRVLRGGGCFYDASRCRSADRSYGAPVFHFDNFGLRLVCVR